MWRIIKKTFRSFAVTLLVVVFFLAGFPSQVLLDYITQTIADKNVVDVLYRATKNSNVVDKGIANLFRPRVEKTQAATTFAIQTGTYVGNGTAKSISGLGFSPQTVIIKSTTTAGVGALFKTTAMPAPNVAYMGAATADLTTGITLNADGFTVDGANTNTANIVHTWIAFTGSDCTASGVFCVGSYQGTAAAKAVTTGFSPDLVWVKPATAVAPSWRSSAMGTNVGQYFSATTQDTTGALFTTLDATGFTVGATNSPTGVTVYFVAFKAVANSISVGTYTGNAANDRNITVTGTTSAPNFVFLKNANAAVAVSAMYNVSESYGDSSSYFTDTANLVDSIQALQSTGFQVGTHSTSNGSGNIIYYAAFGGAAAKSSGSGTFQMATGSYTGTAAVQTIDNLGFKPDLVIIKGNTTQAGAFRASMMGGNSTAYLDSATANFAGGITALNPEGFTIGTSAVVNTNAINYYWTAYGNAFNQDSNSGSADFFVGAYYGNGIDSRNITRLPFQPDLVAVKLNGSSAGAFRTSAHSGDSSSYYTATADAANIIQTFNTDGFQVGTAGNANTAANAYFYFGFKSGTNFTVNSYSGTGSSQNITTVGFQPNNIWVKSPSALYGVSRTSGLAGDGALPFINTASITNAITGIISTGFTVGTATQTNNSGTSYKYAAWKGIKTVSIGVTAGSKAANLNSGDTSQYINSTSCTGPSDCAAFTLSLSSGSDTLTSIKITETGTTDANNNLSNLALFYDTDGNYSNGVTGQFGSTVASFTSETATVSGSLAISSSSTYYFYARFDLANAGTYPKGGETVDLQVAANADVGISGSSAKTGAPATLAGTTTILPNATSVSYGSGLSDGGRSSESITISGYGFGASSAGAGRENCAGAVDTGCARFIVGGNATVANADITAWSNTGITFTINSSLSSDGGASALEVVSGSQSDASDLTFYIYPNITGTSTCAISGDRDNACGTDAAPEYSASDTYGLVKLNGDHFSGTAGTVEFTGAFGSIAGTVHATAEGACSTGDWTSTSVCVEVNSSISNSVYDGTVTLTRTGDSKTDVNNLYILPRIASNSPTSAAIGTAVTIAGDHFCQTGTCPGTPPTANYKTLFGSTEAVASDFVSTGDCAAQGVSWSDTKICVKVPSGTPSGSQPTKIVGQASPLYESQRVAFTVTSSGLPATGDLSSIAFDTGVASGVAYNSIMWKGSLNGSSGKARFQLATSNSSTGPWTYRGGSTCATTDWYDAGTPDVPVEISCAPDYHTGSNQYFKYKIQICSSSDCSTQGSTSPQVTDVVLNWSP